MAKRFQDKEHLRWIAEQPCLIHKGGFYSCQGGVQAHHFANYGLPANYGLVQAKNLYEKKGFINNMDEDNLPF